MLFSAATALLLSSLALANPVPELVQPESRLVDAAAVPIDVGANIVLGTPALLDIGLDSRDFEGSDLSKRLWSDDQKNARKLHNQARATKGLSELLWDAQLAADAKAWAEQLAASGKFEHSPNESRPGQGENLAYSYSSTPIRMPISSSTNLWLAEAPLYQNEVIPQGNFAGYGHYTQCLWSGTKKVGIAAVADAKGAWYIVARYSPPGNIVGQKPY